MQELLEGFSSSIPDRGGAGEARGCLSVFYSGVQMGEGARSCWEFL
nr:MAG TPA: hypothetical protein [Caudoviricetes sp.]